LLHNLIILGDRGYRVQMHAGHLGGADARRTLLSRRRRAERRLVEGCLCD